MECKTHAGVEADFTCQECGRAFCRECVKATGDSLCCPECHDAAVARMATQMNVGKGRAKKQVRARDGKVTEERKGGGKKSRAERRSDKAAIPGLGELEAAPRVLLPEVEAEDAVAVSTWEADAAGLEGTPEDAVPADFEGAAEPLTGRQKKEKAPRKPLRKPAGKHAAPARAGKPAAGAPLESGPAGTTIVTGLGQGSAAEPGSGETAAEPGSVPGSSKVKEEFWDGEEAPRRRHLRSAAKAVSMRVPEEYEGELTLEPSYLKAVLWALLAGAVTAGMYGTVAWLRPKGVPGIFGWFIGFAVGITVVVASGRHFNWKLGLVAAGVALAFLCIGSVLSKMLMYWFPRNDVYDLIASSQSMSGWFKQSLIDLKDQFLTSWWWLVFVITGATAFLVSFRPWPFRLNATGSKTEAESASRPAK